MGRMQRRQKHPQGQHRRQTTPTDVLPLPTEVSQVAKNGDRCENIGLWLDRFLPVRRGDGEAGESRSWELTQKAKRRECVRQLVEQPQVRESVSALKQRYEAILRWFESRGFAVKRVKARPVWRFVVGLGAAHVLETSITLHRLFGLPIIPGSDLKGIARSYAQLVEGKSEGDREIVAVFGTTEQAGEVTFLDAVPLEQPKFQLDIMNPHYPDYYRDQGGNPPADWQSPNPVFFLTVSETEYLFAIAARTERANGLLEVVERWLKGALEELGLGAKTNAGYGYFSLTT